MYISEVYVISIYKYERIIYIYIYISYNCLCVCMYIYIYIYYDYIHIIYTSFKIYISFLVAEW